MSRKINIKETFLKLTSHTYPHGQEDLVISLLPDYLQKDEFGNLFIKIGDTNTMFTSHLDTATSTFKPVKHVIKGSMIGTDGSTILGADDKAGVTIMLNMIENGVPGLYYFFLGEEVGCVGSKKLANKVRTLPLERINKVVSFDRRGTTSVITHQAYGRCCSDEFANDLSEKLNLAGMTGMKPDPTGIYTDSAQFTTLISECTNISVGYYDEHTGRERQDIEYLEQLADACVRVNWEELVVKRDPSVYESAYSGGYGYGWDDYGYGHGFNRRGYTNNNNTYYKKKEENVTKVPETTKEWFYDDEFKYVSCVSIDKHTKKMVSVDLAEDRVNKEKFLIRELMDYLEEDYKYVGWDGFYVNVITKNKKFYKLDRNDVVEFLPGLNYKYYDSQYE